tara:strand:- start:580 stop:933 length:354 start_codon:yes stop_codon:yes gene_type:complete
MKEQYLKIIDIGHLGVSPDDAMAILETVVSKCAYENKVRAIKVITGHGSGALRKILREWCDEQKGRFKGVIYGEDYDMFNKKAVNMRSECHQPQDNDFGKKNSAITYIWLWQKGVKF